MGTTVLQIRIELIFCQCGNPITPIAVVLLGSPPNVGRTASQGRGPVSSDRSARTYSLASFQVSWRAYPPGASSSKGSG
jgi:hypothetical protein